MRLTPKELTAQLCHLEVSLEMRVGDLPAAQIIRAANRKIDLARRLLEPLRDCDQEIRDWLGPAEPQSEPQSEKP